MSRRTIHKFVVSNSRAVSDEFPAQAGLLGEQKPGDVSASYVAVDTARAGLSGGLYSSEGPAALSSRLLQITAGKTSLDNTEMCLHTTGTSPQSFISL